MKAFKHSQAFNDFNIPLLFIACAANLNFYRCLKITIHDMYLKRNVSTLNAVKEFARDSNNALQSVQAQLSFKIKFERK